MISRFGAPSRSRAGNLRGCLGAVFAAALGLCIGSRGADGQDVDAVAAARVLEKAFVDCIAAAEQSVVAIARVEDPVEGSAPLRILDPFAVPGNVRENPRARDFVPDHFGSGLIVSDPQKPDERYVLTTYHVAYGDGSRVQGEDSQVEGLRAFVRLANGELIEATTEPNAADARSDLAVLRLDLEAAGINPADVVPIELGGKEEIRKGRLVVVLGNPYAQARDGSASASIGMISNIVASSDLPPDDARGLMSDDASIHHFGTLLQIDSRLNLGNQWWSR